MWTFSFTSKQSVISVDYYPPIDLGNHNEFMLGLISFQTFNTIPNINSNNNTIKIGNHIIVIPTGAYEISHLNNYIQEQVKNLNFNCTFDLEGNVNTFDCILTCSHDVDLSSPNSVASLLGFDHVKLPANVVHVSTHPVNILKINTIKILCNLTTNSYENGYENHILHEFFPTVPPGYRIVETPHNVIYLPITTNLIRNITLKIVDQDGEVVNFQDEVITIRLHLKKL